MNIILDKIYVQLKRLKSIKDKGDFAEKLGYNRSYISELMNSDEQEIPEKLQISLQEKFGITKDFAKNGTGEMFSTLQKGKFYDSDKVNMPFKKQNWIIEALSPWFGRLSNPSAEDLKQATLMQEQFNSVVKIAEDYRNKYEDLQKEFEAYKKKNPQK